MTTPPAEATRASEGPTVSPPLIEATDLARHYPMTRKWRNWRNGWAAPPVVRAIDGVDLVLAAGETVGVVGESGSGKSTLARLLTLIEVPTRGTLRIAGVDIGTATPAARRALRGPVQMVFQNPTASLNPRKRVEQMLAEPLLLNTPLDAPERRRRIAAMLLQVGLRAEHADRYPHQFSGGERQRVAIARAMMLGPRLLVADEPTSALDVSVQAQILNLLMDLQQASGFGCVLISHNLGVVEHMADRVMVMRAGRVVETAPKQLLFTRPLHPYTRALLAATPRVDRHIAAQAHVDGTAGDAPDALVNAGGCSYRRRCAHASERCRDEVPALREVGGAGVACHHAEAIVAAGG